LTYSEIKAVSGRPGDFRVKVLRKARLVEESKCTGCGTCIEVCPYGAMRKNERGLAEVVAAVCKGCGSCGAPCPELAISIANYSDEQLFAEAKAAFEEV
jgi:heterodisulfide reductase subunit A